MKRLVINWLRFYQKWFSPDQGLPRAVIPHYIKFCRFTPSCSEYMVQAVKKYGIIRGGVKGVWRLLRCNPFVKGGQDLVN